MSDIDIMFYFCLSSIFQIKEPYGEDWIDVHSNGYAIDLYAQGMTTQSVAHRMSVSETTVKIYARRAYKKLGVGSRAEAVAVLARRGVI